MTDRPAVPRGVWLMAAGLWGLFLLGMYHWDKLPLFQASPYYYFTGAAGVVLVLLAVKGALWPSRAVCACGHTHGHGEPCAAERPAEEAGEEPSAEPPVDRGIRRLVGGIALLVFLMAPVLAGILIPHRSLNAFAAMKRGMGLESSELLEVYRRERRQWEAGAGEYLRANPLDVLEIGRDKPGLKVRTVGFVYRSEDMPADVLTVARFKITCCAADATPVAVAVRWPEAAKFESDTWVEVRGAVERQTIQGREVTVIVADNLREVEAPEKPYI